MSTAFGQECTQGRDLGFDGKTLIHPGQIEACNAIFTPPAEEVAHARKIIAAFERPENAARGAISLDGQMVERLHADMAKRTIAIIRRDRGDGAAVAFPHPEEPRPRGVSKDERCGLSWFETAQERLLTMRNMDPR